MSKRAVVRTLVLLTMNVGIAAPLVAHAQLLSEIEISCDASDSLQTALATVAPGGRIIIRSGACPGNLVISRDWGGGLFVDKASKAVVIHSTIVLDSARFGAGVASNNTVAMLAALLSGNLGASKGASAEAPGESSPRAGIC